MSTLDRAIEIAVKAHAGQIDKAGAPYILHPLRMMLRLTTDDERIVAVLHDVVEDSGVTLDDLRKEGFSGEIIEGVASVTKIEDEDYFDFIRRAAANPIGRRVKLADLEDNGDISRIANPGANDMVRTEKYRKAIEFIRSLEPST